MGLMVISADDGHLLMFWEGVYEFMAVMMDRGNDLWL